MADIKKMRKALDETFKNYELGFCTSQETANNALQDIVTTLTPAELEETGVVVSSEKGTTIVNGKLIYKGKEYNIESIEEIIAEVEKYKYVVDIASLSISQTMAYLLRHEPDLVKNNHIILPTSDDFWWLNALSHNLSETLR